MSLTVNGKRGSRVIAERARSSSMLSGVVKKGGGLRFNFIQPWTYYKSMAVLKKRSRRSFDVNILV